MISLLSISGSPGVSTLALASAIHAPHQARSCLVEADPIGSSPTLAGYLKGSRRLEETSAVNLVAPNQRGELAAAFPSQLVPLSDDGRVGVLPGLVHAGQAYTARVLWGPLSDLLAEMSIGGDNIVVDAGRIGHAYYPWPMVTAADVVALVVRSERAAVAAARAGLDAIHRTLENNRSRAPLGVIVVESGPYAGREVAQALGLPLVASVPHDATGAGEYSHGAALTGMRRRRSPYITRAPKLWRVYREFADNHRPDWLAATDDGSIQ